MHANSPAAARKPRARRAVASAFGLVLALAAPPAPGLDGLSFEAGPDGANNGTRVDLYRAGAQWNWDKRWFESRNWHVGGYWDFQYGYWNNRSANRTDSSLWEIAFTPVLRLQQSTPSTIAPYAEIGIGAHLLSETTVNAKRDLGSAFQFGSHAGVGARFGPKNAFDISYRYQHISNADIKEPNDGMDFHVLRFGYWFK